MLIVNLKRIFRSGFINFWRSAVVSLASVVTITVTLFVIGGLWLSAAFLDSALEEVKSKVDISVSLKPEVVEATALAFQEKLSRLPEVRAVDYRSREEELADFEERNRDNDLIIQSLAEVGNPFGARLNIQAIDPAHYESIARFLESDSARDETGAVIIDQISFKKQVVEKLTAIVNTSKTIGLAITLVLVCLSVLVTFNTVSLAIYVSREEISLMKLVGAGNNYVRGPFIVEGIIAGAIAAGLALLLLYPAAIWVRNLSAGVFGGIDLVGYYLSHLPLLLFGLLAIGAVLGIGSSFLAIRRHLRK